LIGNTLHRNGRTARCDFLNRYILFHIEHPLGADVRLRARHGGALCGDRDALVSAGRSPRLLRPFRYYYRALMSCQGGTGSSR
jgi:hypothetical protein